MAVVKARPGDTADSMIRKFSKKVFDEGIVEEAKKREFFKKPSEIKKEKRKELKKKFRKIRR
ncbi:30S ribosomal protein S21 [Candidatus Microgenomates bacterium]|nr:30S ribosomal protein S21 [Candidatus Microgenomates bacterium]